MDLATLPEREYAAPIPAVVETPWELLLATGEAVRRHRTELLDAMVAGQATTLAGDSTGALEGAADADVRLWHEQLEVDARGRLHAAVMGRGGRGRRRAAGIVEWVLLGDGWRSLTPSAATAGTWSASNAAASSTSRASWPCALPR